MNSGWVANHVEEVLIHQGERLLSFLRFIVAKRHS
jgi:hypothetical protein